MPIQDQLAFALDRNDQEPNKLVAKQITNAGGIKEVKELISFIKSKPKQRAQSDAILVLAYVGELAPTLLSDEAPFLISQLNSSVNRVIFGSMIALAHIAHLTKGMLFDSLPQIIDAMDSGTVVTRDYGFRIMVTLYTDGKYKEDMFLLIQEQLMKAPSNQLGQYAERLMEVLNKDHLKPLIDTLEDRRNDVSNEHHIKRLNKNLKKLYKQL
ncbi:hypothetical protein [Ekhidna sp.]|jgi:hypothetical protein|uniref:hypothetical protein n=1 Tax=Ekhidna sp. TaxID=2608089 RepID=UPI0032EE27D6